MPKTNEKQDKQIKVNEEKFLCPDKITSGEDCDYGRKYFVKNMDFMDDFVAETARNFIRNIRLASKIIREQAYEDTDIYLYINSRGGEVIQLLAMIDAMSLVPNDFVTVGIGQCASCGAVFLSCGTKGKRYITPNARVLIHQVRGGVFGTNSEIQADAKEYDRLNKLLVNILATNCGKTVEEIEEATKGGDLILTAEEAVEFGIVDAILTPEIASRFRGDQVDTPPVESEKPEVVVSEQKGAKTIERTSMKMEVKSIDDDGENYHITAIASTPDADRVSDIVEPVALLDSVKRIGLPAFAHQHNLKDMPLGVCESVTQTAKGETIVKLAMPKDDYSDAIKRRIDIGAYQGLSIGYIAKETERNTEGYRVIKALDWYEVSLVTVPANPNAKILQVKDGTHEILNCDIMQDIKTIRDVENLLVSVGCTKKEAGYVIKVVKSSQGEPSDEGEGEPSQNDVDIELLIGLKNVLTNK